MGLILLLILLVAEGIKDCSVYEEAVIDEQIDPKLIESLKLLNVLYFQELQHLSN
jgi:hypothetical protein